MDRQGKAQSAMEYLMTYGWAILIIAVVLGALYSLGVFNAVNFMPKVPGGGCHVFRPNGPGTSWNVNLVGSCNNALPQFVAQFNGQSSYITMGTNSLFNFGTTPFTVTAWVNPNSTATAGFVSKGEACYSGGWQMNTNGERTYLEVGDGTTGFSASSGTVAPNTWQFLVGTVSISGGNDIITFYYNGQQAAQNQHTLLVVSGPWVPSIGSISGCGSSGVTPMHGSIANVQIYNTSLTANQVAYLYNEGIGGVPISPQYLVGWWPLNGDTNDYSGNNNNGAATAVTFNGTWTNGYNVP